MLLRRNKPATTATSNGGSDGHAGTEAEHDEDEDGEYDTEGVDAEYDDGDEHDDGDAETDGEYDEDAEYDDSADDEYDEDADDSTDEDADDSTDDQYDDNADDDSDSDNGSNNDDEDFTPPTAMSAIRNSLRSGRPRAQPATGTEEDGRRVNFIDKRERLIGYFLGVAMMALAVVAYIHYHHLVYPKDITTQNAYRREAPWLLAITLGLGLLIVLATLFKRRAALGFTLLLAGAGNPSGQLLISLIYLGTGLWLIFRAMRRSPSKAARLRAGAGGAGATGAGARRGASSTASSRTSTATTAATSASGTRTAASTTTSGRTIGRNGRLSNTQTSGRYTPPKPTRRPPPTVQPEAEPSNRLASWLKK
jgi:hypothetical protein